ncbi:MAG: hypothetical protein AAGD43_37525, partial [Pseudomonadota bacterium]
RGRRHGGAGIAGKDAAVLNWQTGWGTGCKLIWGMGARGYAELGRAVLNLPNTLTQAIENILTRLTRCCGLRR